MEQLAKVRCCNPDGTAQVVVLRQSACSGDCHKCSGCGAVQQKLLITVCNTIGAQPGDTVRIVTETGPVLLGAAMVYLLPLVLFFLGYLWGILGGIAGFLLGVGIAVCYDRLVAKKKKPTYRMTGFGQLLPEEGRESN